MSAVWHTVTTLLTGGPASPAWWLAGPGLAGIFTVLFAETCTPAGFFLPGDSLLLTAGMLAAGPAAQAAHTTQPRLSLPAVILVALAGTIAGMQAGYLLGRRAGRSLQPGGRHPLLASAADRGGRLLMKAGPGRALLVARFIPVVRVVIAPLCGSAGWPAGRFTRWQSAGAAIWTVSTTTAGYLAARAVPGLPRYLVPAMVICMAVSTVITLIRARRGRRAGQATTRTADDPSGQRRTSSRSAIRS